MRRLIAGLSPAERRAAIKAMKLSPAEADRLMTSWRLWARDEQLARSHGWDTWLVMAGRGFGKTRTGAEWVHRRAWTHHHARIAIVGPTHHDVRSVMIEGPSGLLNTGDPDRRPTYEPSRKRLEWGNGAVGLIFSADEPETLRGPQFAAAWGDEVGRWPNGVVLWDNLRLGLRESPLPQVVLTTTPRPTELLKRLLAAERNGDGRVVVTRGRTADNIDNLPRAFIEAVNEMYAGTTLGRQELDGELIEEVEGALWTRALIEGARVGATPEMRRVVVGVDPPASAGEGADACGIVVCGLGTDGRGYVLADASLRSPVPNGWANAVARAYHGFAADRVIAEANNGGDMVAGVLRAVDAGLPIRGVRASRGKSARAEPVAALYAAGRVSHAGVFPELEDELCGLTTGGAYRGPGRSPDRADALVWALSELMLKPKRPMPRVWIG